MTVLVVGLGVIITIAAVAIVYRSIKGCMGCGASALTAVVIAVAVLYIMHRIGLI
jgi:hypothetical protein